MYYLKNQLVILGKQKVFLRVAKIHPIPRPMPNAKRWFQNLSRVNFILLIQIIAVDMSVVMEAKP